MTHPDVPAEQAHVDLAYARLAAMRAAAMARLQDAFGERGGTFQALTERDIRVRNSLNRLEQLEIGRESLVFGRIDRRAGDGPAGTNGADGATEAFHIGRLAISDRDQEPVVVDWRAPIAEPFYRATGAHPMGLTRRRHFLTEGHRVLDLEDELFDADGSESGVGLGLSGPQVLLATLERSRTGRMRDIVATVQREQDEIIRGPLPGILVVQGGPGTGKTAVALHRAAYLLYTHRFPLEGQGVLVVGPNPTFLRYIEHVLPSLDENGVELSTVNGLFSGRARLAARRRPSSVSRGIPGWPGLSPTPLPTGSDPSGARSRCRSGRGCCASRPLCRAKWSQPPSGAPARTTPGAEPWRFCCGGYLLDQVAPPADGLGDPERRHRTPDRRGTGPGPSPAAGSGGRARAHVADPHPAAAPPRPVRRATADRTGRGQGVLDPQERCCCGPRARAASAGDVVWTDADIPLLDEAGPCSARTGGRRGPVSDMTTPAPSATWSSTKPRTFPRCSCAWWPGGPCRGR
jgi:hypothetical protein